MKAPVTCNCKPSPKWKWLRFKFFALWVFTSSVSAAYESFPEFRGLDTTEASSFDRPQDITSEYSSDFVTYLKPLSWDHSFYFSGQAYDVSAGSLSSKEFQLDQRLKVYKALNPFLEFRLSWFQDRDLEEDASGQIVEMIYWTPARVGLSVYGNLSLFKSENDLGMAVLRRSEEGEVRLFVTLPDFQRNQRNLNSDRWDTAPVVYGFLLRRQPKPNIYSEISLRYEAPARWEFPDQQKAYDYQRQTLQVSLQRRNWSLRLFADRKHESQGPLSGSSVTNEVWQRDRHFAYLDREMDLAGRPLRVGIHWFHRDYLKMNQTLIYRDIIPVLWYEWSPNWDLGYDSTLHWVADYGNLLSESPKSFGTQHRLNLGFNHAFHKAGKLRLLMTVDLDRFGSGETWEGGAAQLQLNF